VPAAQGAHAAAPGAAAKLPAGQLAQSASVLLLHARAANWPAPHLVHGVQAARPPGEKEAPGAQTVQALLPAGAALPAPQKPHTVLLVLEQADKGAKPAAQALHGSHEEAPLRKVKVRAAHGAQEAASVPALVLPGGHSEQKRSTVAEPGCDAETTLPAGHVAQGRQAAAPAAAAKNPDTHAVHDLAPSAAAVPAGHAEHTASLVAEPGVEGNEPAAQTVKGAQDAAPALAAKVPAAQGVQEGAPAAA